MSKREIYRILDVAANRGREALRVVEDAARFLDDNEALTQALKSARHRFAAASEKLDRRERMLARDTNADVGTTLETDDEYERATLLDVLTANFARLQESARSLEEFSKIVEPRLAREWERLRYDSYTLEKMAYAAAARYDSSDSRADVKEEEKAEPTAPVSQDASCGPDNEESSSPVYFPFAGPPARTPRESRRARLQRATLGLFLNRPLNVGDFDELTKANIDLFQICVDLTNDLSVVTSKVFIERFVGCYLDDETPVTKRPLLLSRGFTLWGDAFDGGVVENGEWRVAREQIGPDYLIGAAVSNLDDALDAIRAARDGIVDFIELGPVFATDARREGTGTPFLRAVLEAVDGEPGVPVFAFGGVDRNNCVDVFDSGIDRVCVGSAIWDAQDRVAAAKILRSLF